MTEGLHSCECLKFLPKSSLYRNKGEQNKGEARWRTLFCKYVYHNWAIYGATAGTILSAGNNLDMIPDESLLTYHIRAPNVDELNGLVAKVETCFHGAGEATGCSVSFEKGIIYKNMVFNNTLDGIYRKHAESMG